MESAGGRQGQKRFFLGWGILREASCLFYIFHNPLRGGARWDRRLCPVIYQAELA